MESVHVRVQQPGSVCRPRWDAGRFGRSGFGGDSQTTNEYLYSDGYGSYRSRDATGAIEYSGIGYSVERGGGGDGQSSGVQAAGDPPGKGKKGQISSDATTAIEQRNYANFKEQTKDIQVSAQETGRFLLELIDIFAGTNFSGINYDPNQKYIGGGAPSFGLKAVAAKTGATRVFWSGGKDAMKAAESYAKANGMTTLEMTRAGQNLTKLTQGMQWEQAGPMWQRLSAAYAKGANGSVHVFQNATTGVRMESVWRTVEYPILKGKNDLIYHNIFVP